MASMQELSLKIRVHAEELKKLSTESKRVASDVEKVGKQGVSTFSAFNSKVTLAAGTLLRLTGIIGAIGASLGALAGGVGLGSLIRRGIEFNSVIETSQLGIAAILASTQRVTDEYGQALTGAERFAASIEKSAEIQERLQAINLETSATYREIVQTYQSIAAPAAANKFTIEETLQLTKLTTQATKALGLESNQVVQESRDLLSGTIDRNSQLALALGITNEQLKLVREEGRLYEFLVDKLGEFARAGELTQGTLSGLVSNLGDALDKISGIAFRPVFDFLKGTLQDVTNELITVEDGTIKINQKWLEVGETIATVVVGALEIATGVAGALINAVSDAILGFKQLVNAPLSLGTIRAEIKTTQSSVDLLQGSYGVFIDDLKLSEGVYQSATTQANNLAGAMGNINTQVNSVTQAWVSAKGPMDDYFTLAIQRVQEFFQAQQATSVPPNFTAFLEQENKVVAAKQKQVEVQAKVEQSTISLNRFMEKHGLTLGQVSEGTNRYSATIANLGISLDTAEANGAKFEAIQTTIAESAGKGKSKIDQLNDSLINQAEQLQVSVDTFGLSEREIIDYTYAVTIAKGGSAELALVVRELSLEFLELKEAVAGLEEFLSDQEDAFKKFIDQQTKALDDFADLNLRFLPEPERIRAEGEEVLRAIKEIVRQRPELEKQAQELTLRVVEQYGERIADAERQAYIERLRDAGGFFNNLKAGFLEFALSVESNGELAAQFFADTLSQMSQNFSDFFYNVITGKFDDLVDVAKNAFRAILRAFLDMVSAIATRQIVVSIAGSLGIGKGQPGGAAGALGLGKDALGLAGAGFGLFGGGAAAGGATAAAIGGAAGGIGSVGVSGLTGGISVGTLAGGGSTGILATIGAAAPYVGAVLAAAAIAYTIIGPLLKKTPRLDIDFDSVKTDMGRRAAVVEEFLSPDFFLENIGQVSVKRGGVGIGAGGDEKILELIQQRIQETVEGIQDIIRRLPAEIFNQLNETLLNAEIDIDTVIGGERLLEFDAKGKKIAEKFQAFIEGELPAKFFAAIRDSFFAPAFQALGVSAEGTQQLIDDFMAKMEAAGSREERAVIGQEFLNTFSAFVDAFNIVSGNANDAIGQTMNTIKGLANSLGFEAVPSIEELRLKLGELIENAELDPETVQAYADLRNAIVSLTSEVVNSISGLIGKMQSLNQTMASLGLATIDMSGYLSQAASDIQTFLQNNQGQLSLGEQEAFLDQLTGIANAMLAEEQAAFQKAHEALVAAGEAQKEVIQQNIDSLTQQKEAITEATQARIEGLNQEKERINEAFRARQDALNEELKLAQDFAAAAESIRNTLDGIIFSQQSIFTAVERVNMLQGNISELQNQLANTDDPTRQLDLIKSLEGAFKTLFDTAGEAFGVNSPEFVSIFDQVTGGLSDLANLTENSGRSVEEIQAEIERLTVLNEAHLASIDARIAGAQAQSEAQLRAIDDQIASMRDVMAAIDEQIAQHTFVASQELQDLFAYIQSEQQRLLDERFKQLGEINTWGFQTETEGLGVIAGFVEENLVTLKEQTGYMEQQLMQLEHNTELLETIANNVGGAPGFAGGSGGLKDFGDRTLAFLHGQEAVLTKAQYLSIMGSMEAAISLQRNFGNVLQSFTGAMSGIGLLNKFANEIQGGTNLSNLTQKLTKGGYISSLAGELPRTPEQVVRERTAELAKENEGPFRIELTINSNNPGVVQVAAEKVAEEVEKRLVKRLDPAAKTMREAVQNRARKANR